MSGKGASHPILALTLPLIDHTGRLR